MQAKVPAVGPQPAKVLIVGEAPGKTEEEKLRPFSGSSGHELTKMLNEAGILRTEVRVTNVCKYRPPQNNIELWVPEKKKDIKANFVRVFDKVVDPRVAEGVEELRAEIEATQPNVIIALGNTALWALCGETGITKWRGSILSSRPELGSRKVVPSIHPAMVLRKWDWRYLVVHDLRRAKREQEFPEIRRPPEHFIVGPSFEVARDQLKSLIARAEREPMLLAADIETKSRHLACLGVAWSKHDAMCVPLASADKPEGFYSLDEELELVLLFRELLTHPNARVIGQNWQYDYQYIAKYWGFEVNLFLDIMSEHHVHFAGLQKGLDFMSSLYRDHHVFWKDDGKEQGKGNDVQWWTYNCRDCVATYEIAEVLLSLRATSSIRGTSYGTPFEIQQRLSSVMARASARGTRKNADLAGRLAFLLQEDLRAAESWVNDIVGYELNVRSFPQLSKLFYEDLNQPKILHRKSRKPTLDDDALETIGKRDILLRPLTQAINYIRSLGNYISVCLKPTDADGRFRCQYTIPGTETYRFSSSTDPFGFGTNLQNITSGQERDKDFPLPNLRKLFVPDEGFCLGEFDMPQADARVVAWEAEDEDLIAIFEDPTRDLHNENCEAIFGSRPKDKYDIRRYFSKQGVHLTNYGGNEVVLAAALGITRMEAYEFQRKWFSAHPKIKEWHRRIELELATRRYVENKYGYRRFYFDRVEDLLKEALAWIPQSTVAIATNLGILAATSNERLRKLRCEFLLQCHDSSLFQWPKIFTPVVLEELTKSLTISVPYAKPLVFRAGAKISDKSWGELEDVG